MSKRRFQPQKWGFWGHSHPAISQHLRLQKRFWEVEQGTGYFLHFPQILSKHRLFLPWIPSTRQRGGAGQLHTRAFFTHAPYRPRRQLAPFHQRRWFGRFCGEDGDGTFLSRASRSHPCPVSGRCPRPRSAACPRLTDAPRSRMICSPGTDDLWAAVGALFSADLLPHFPTEKSGSCLACDCCQPLVCLPSPRTALVPKCNRTVYASGLEGWLQAHPRPLAPPRSLAHSLDPPSLSPSPVKWQVAPRS